MIWPNALARSATAVSPRNKGDRCSCWTVDKIYISVFRSDESIHDASHCITDLAFSSQPWSRQLVPSVSIQQS